MDDKNTKPAASSASASADRLAVARAIADLDRKLKSLEAELGLSAQEAPEAAGDDPPKK